MNKTREHLAGQIYYACASHGLTLKWHNPRNGKSIVVELNKAESKGSLLLFEVTLIEADCTVSAVDNRSLNQAATDVESWVIEDEWPS